MGEVTKKVRDDLKLFHLSEDVLTFLNEICEYTSHKIDKKNKHSEWIGKWLYEFIKPDQRKYLKRHQKLFRNDESNGKIKVLEDTFDKMPSDGMGKANALKLFCFSAIDVYERSVEEHLKIFIKRCKENKREHPIFNEEAYASIIKDLIGEPYHGSAEDASPQPSAGDPYIERQHISNIYNGNKHDVYGDAIEIEKVGSQIFEATVRDPFSARKHEHIGQFLISKKQKKFDQWTEKFSEDAKGFMTTRIDNEAGPESVDGAKIGIAAYHSSAAASKLSVPLVIYPINHLLTVAFNRNLGLERLNGNTNSQAHKVWEKSFRDIRASLQDTKFTCPSQLFVEVGLVTSDGYIPIPRKHPSTSVYALRHKEGQLKTCGLEDGPNWKDVIAETGKKNIVELNIRRSIILGLKRKFPMPDWDSKADQLEIKMICYAHQMMHLNTAILGYCKIPYTKDEIAAELHGKKENYGGLDHSELFFIHAHECDKYVRDFSKSTDWHGTAIMRLKIIADNIKDIIS